MNAITLNLASSVGVLTVILVALWLLSLKIKDASIIDIFWGAGFGIVALVCLYHLNALTSYTKLLAALPIIWALRLSLYLAKRNIGHGEDPRYTAMRKRKKAQNWAWYTASRVYFGQGVLIVIVSAPIWVGMATGRATDIGVLSMVGAALWLIGFLFEAIGDWQLARFIKANKDYDGPYETKPVLDTGLWKYTRHPNYFGNACMWWGIWLVACQAPLGWATIIAPLIMTYLLVRISGKALLERKLKTRPAYADYVARTPGFIPGIPKKKA